MNDKNFRLSEAREQLTRLQILITRERNWVVSKWGESELSGLDSKGNFYAYNFHDLYKRANDIIKSIQNHENKKRTYIVTESRYLSHLY